MTETTAPASGSAPDETKPYDDTLAINDIHAVLTSPGLTGAAEDALRAIGDIIARTGRSPYPSRIIIATVEDSPHGVPVACVDSEGTVVNVGQDPNGPGIRIDVSPRDPAEEAALVIVVGGRVILRACRASFRSVPPRDGGQS